jgi:hypothetical protein
MYQCGDSRLSLTNAWRGPPRNNTVAAAAGSPFLASCLASSVLMLVWKLAVKDTWSGPAPLPEAPSLTRQLGDSPFIQLTVSLPIRR